MFQTFKWLNIKKKQLYVWVHTSLLLCTVTVAQEVHGQLLDRASEALKSRHRGRHDEGSRGTLVWSFYQRTQGELDPVYLQAPVLSQLVNVHLHRAKSDVSLRRQSETQAESGLGVVSPRGILPVSLSHSGSP